MKFFEVSVGALFALRPIIDTLGKAIAGLFASEDRDVAISDRSIGGRKGVDENNRPFSEEASREIVTDSISVEMAEARIQFKQKSVSDLVSAIMDPKNKELLGRFLMDSLAEEYPRGSNDNPKPSEFFDSLPAGAVVQMLTGAAIANKGVLGPLGETLGQMQGIIEKAVKERVNKIALASPTTEDKTPG